MPTDTSDLHVWQEVLTWIGAVVCLLHSAMFSGLNLALFSLNRLHLEIEADHGNPDAVKVLGMRRDANFLLTTILWGNVAVNTLLTLLLDSVLAGAAAFAVSTFGITFIGEIIPQAYFSRHALRMGAKLVPLLSFYRKVFWIVAFPSAKLLDAWLGQDGVHYVREEYLRAIIEKHMNAKESDLDHREGAGALNFLSLDDLPVGEEGEVVNPVSIIQLPSKVDLPIVPEFQCDPGDPFVAAVAASQRKWVILTDPEDLPRLVLDADGFLRAVLGGGGTDVDAYDYCHRPIMTTNPTTPFGKLLRQLRVEAQYAEDDVIDRDIILLWGEQRRVVTGADLLGRLLRGIASQEMSQANPPVDTNKLKALEGPEQSGPSSQPS